MQKLIFEDVFTLGDMSGVHAESRPVSVLGDLVVPASSCYRASLVLVK